MIRKLALLGVTAFSTLALSACHGNGYANQGYVDPGYAQPAAMYASGPTGVCVDRHSGMRVPENQCGAMGYGGGMSPFMWYYIGAHSQIPYYGQHYYGGTFTRARGYNYVAAPASTRVVYSTAQKAAAVSRGGLGSTARVSTTTTSSKSAWFSPSRPTTTTTTTSYSSSPSSSYSSSRSSYSSPSYSSSSSYSSGRSFSSSSFSSAGS